MWRSSFARRSFAALFVALLCVSPAATFAASEDSSSSSSRQGEDEGGSGDAAKAIAIAAAAIGIAAFVASLDVAPGILAPRADIPFGGLILAGFPCTATSYGTPGWYVLAFDYKTLIPIPMVILPYSRVNMWYAPFTGNAILGTFMPVPGVCTVSGEDYEPVWGFVSAPPLAGIGTSLIPFSQFVPKALPV